MCFNAVSVALLMGIQAVSRDIITDFVNGTDRIDLSAIDANSTTIGTGAFAGGGTADFQIQLTGHHTMTAADLML